MSEDEARIFKGILSSMQHAVDTKDFPFYLSASTTIDGERIRLSVRVEKDS